MLVDPKKTLAPTGHLYFIGGIFGTGKSTLCQTLSRLLPATHLKASELIGYVPNPDDPTGKSVRRVLNNQERLIVALADRRTGLKDVLLDGHFCLFDQSSVIQRIPVKIFECIRPAAIVLVESSSEEVSVRIRLRDDRILDPSLIKDLLEAEREHSKYVSDVLGVPMINVDALTPTSEILAFLRSSS
jgi:adenylate kinase